MENSNTISVLFTVRQGTINKKYAQQLDEAIESLCFVVDKDSSIEFDIEHVEQLNDCELEIEILLQGWKLHSIFNIVKHPLTIIVGTCDGEIEIEPSMLSIKEIVELGDDEEVYYDTETLERL